ncbi:MAG TPA: hypothetical protein PLB18_02500 [Acidobacteriota bacterium]|nr:hypothetical protein [Acidobacteriota bacterium]HNC43703.1 hypothetical protein [Acidobacteriota bacterium]HND18213.1 hypothetical protein [Acidobacteriota bacterium]HNG93333.1 hypothetical protein [Acidobacteriota bacterium]HNH81273.1 hypothetical protein [Acidobacteriota bacterium]
MRTFCLLLFCALFGVGSVTGLTTGSALSASQKPEPHQTTFELPVPPGWKTETIPFPLGFAPELPYRGVEELRFAPGFFKAGQPDFWSYTFVWYLEGNPDFSADDLSSDLKAYFQGLAKAVEKKEAYTSDKAAVKTDLKKVAASPAGHTLYVGTVANYDAFVTHNRLLLNLKLDVFRCEKEKRKVVVCQLSPQPTTHEIWKTLEQIANGFQCSRP